jgi:hypothetical protein
MATSFPISKHEKLAVILAGASLFIGLILAWCFTPVWLNRAGSLVIVIGVLLATSRLTDISQANVENLISDNFDKGMAEAIRNIEETHGHILGNDQREALRKGVYASITNGFSGLFEDWRRRVKRYEVSLVVAGTLINGFGDWLFCLARTCASA